MEMPTLQFPGRTTRWVMLVLVWVFNFFAAILALGLATSRTGAQPAIWESLLVVGGSTFLALGSMCFGGYFTLVMFRAKLFADEKGIYFRNIRTTFTFLQWSEIERATTVYGGMDQWKYHRCLLVVTQTGARHRINAVPYLFNRGSIYIQQWVDFINFKCGGQELSGWQVHDDSRHLAPFTDLQTFKQAVNNEFLK